MNNKQQLKTILEADLKRLKHTKGSRNKQHEAQVFAKSIYNLKKVNSSAYDALEHILCDIFDIGTGGFPQLYTKSEALYYYIYPKSRKKQIERSPYNYFLDCPGKIVTAYTYKDAMDHISAYLEYL